MAYSDKIGVEMKWKLNCSAAELFLSIFNSFHHFKKGMLTQFLALNDKNHYSFIGISQIKLLINSSAAELFFNFFFVIWCWKLCCIWRKIEANNSAAQGLRSSKNMAAPGLELIFR